MTLKTFVKRMLTVGSVLFSLLLLAGIVTWGRAERYWPWSTGGENRAMLGATFEMSIPEVQRATKQRLLTCGEALGRLRSKHGDVPFEVTLNCDGEWSPREQAERTEARFIETIEVFETPAWFELMFFDGRLESMSAHFEPYTDASTKAAQISKELESRGYTFAKREDSKEVPGAYSVSYRRGRVTANLWVNLTEPKEPILSLSLWDEGFKEQRDSEAAERNRRAL